MRIVNLDWKCGNIEFRVKIERSSINLETIFGKFTKNWLKNNEFWEKSEKKLKFVGKKLEKN